MVPELLSVGGAVIRMVLTWGSFEYYGAGFRPVMCVGVPQFDPIYSDPPLVCCPISAISVSGWLLFEPH